MTDRCSSLLASQVSHRQGFINTADKAQSSSHLMKKINVDQYREASKSDLSVSRRLST
jgi:hypothetical protein